MIGLCSYQENKNWDTYVPTAADNFYRKVISIYKGKNIPVIIGIDSQPEIYVEKIHYYMRQCKYPNLFFVRNGLRTGSDKKQYYGIQKTRDRSNLFWMQSVIRHNAVMHRKAFFDTDFSAVSGSEKKRMITLAKDELMSYTLEEGGKNKGNYKNDDVVNAIFFAVQAEEISRNFKDKIFPVYTDNSPTDFRGMRTVNPPRAIAAQREQETIMRSVNSAMYQEQNRKIVQMLMERENGRVEGDSDDQRLKRDRDEHEDNHNTEVHKFGNVAHSGTDGYYNNQFKRGRYSNENE